MKPASCRFLEPSKMQDGMISNGEDLPSRMLETWPLYFRCVHCGSSLGAWQRQRDEWRCDTCGQLYRRVNGVLDFVGAHETDDRRTPDAGQMSSFAKPTIEEPEWKVLSLRLQALFSTEYFGTEPSISSGDLTARPVTSSMLLDVGCGYGGLVAYAGSRFGLVVGVDADREQLQSAKTLLKQKFPDNLVLIRAHAEKLPFLPGQFSAVTCVQTLEHVFNPEAVIAQIRLMLAPGGRVYISVPNRFTLRREPHTNLRWIGWLPKRLAMHYARRFGKEEQLRGVHFLSVGKLSAMLRRTFGTSFQLIRSGCHQSALGKLAKTAWHVPPLSVLAAHLVGDIEVVAWK